MYCGYSNKPFSKVSSLIEQLLPMTPGIILKIESIMDPYDTNKSSTTKVSKDAIIETLAESILNSKEILTVIDESNNNQPVGSLDPSKVIKVIFGK